MNIYVHTENSLLFITSAGLTPKELCLNLDVAIYYFFLQLYALFPNNFFQYLRTHYSQPDTLERFNESIAVSTISTITSYNLAHVGVCSKYSIFDKTKLCIYLGSPIRLCV